HRAYWALDRWLLEPLILRPTEWLLARTTDGYAWLLAWSLRCWGAVLVLGAVLIGIAVAFIWFALLGVELTPSEDQSRFVAHIVCRIGSSIDYVDDRLQQCEGRLQAMPEVASFLTTVATEPGQLMNESDIFVQLVPRSERALTQLQVMKQV